MKKFKLIIKKMGSKVKKCYDAVYKKAPYIEPVLIISGSLLVAVSIIVTVKGAFNVDDVSVIEANPGKVAFYNKNYDVAIEEYEKLQKDSEWPFWEVKIAEVHSVQGKLGKSNEILNSVMKKRSKVLSDINKEAYEKDYKEKDRELINYVVFTYFMNEEYEEAIRIGEEFISENGKDKELMRTMFAINRVHGNEEKAKDILEKYEVDNDSAYDLSLLAQMNIISGNLDEGLKLLNEAVKKDENEIKVLDVINEVATYDRDKILIEIENLIAENPENLVYKIWLAKVYSMHPETYDEAISIIEDIEKEDKKTVMTNIIKANVYRNIGNNEEANKALEDAIKIDENSYISYYISAWRSFYNKEYDKALESAKNSILANKSYPNNYGILIPEIMKAKQKSEVSEAYFRTALQKEPFNYNIMIKIADYYLDKSIENKKAREYYNLAIPLAPNDSEIYYDLARVDLIDKNIESAISNLNKAIEINETNAKYYRTLGTVYLNEKEYDKGIENIRNAYEIDEDDVLTLNNAGVYYIAIEGNIERGMVNIEGAYEAINTSMSDEIKAKISKNYNKVKKIYDEYNKGYESEILISDFELFY